MKVLLTHSEGKLLGLEPKLRKLNLTAIHQAALKINFINNAQTQSKAQKLLELPWLFFTSQYAIEAWHSLDLSFKNKVAVVGKKSANTLANYSKKADIIAKPQNAKGLLAEFLKNKAKDCPVGLVKGNLSLKLLEQGLAKNNCRSESLIIYQSQIQKIDQSAEIVVLASPSAVNALAAKLSKAKLVAIGPSTAQAVANRGWQCYVAASPSVNSIVKTIEGLL